ncbi:hypothetical protein [Nostoc sp. C110]|uniref:hypothetical protein n=1 Tax=Nostoc sp. C110 TaxID=3349876 RepID=UPI00370DC54C
MNMVNGSTHGLNYKSYVSLINVKIEYTYTFIMIMNNLGIKLSSSLKKSLEDDLNLFSDFLFDNNNQEIKIEETFSFFLLEGLEYLEQWKKYEEKLKNVGINNLRDLEKFVEKHKYKVSLRSRHSEYSKSYLKYSSKEEDSISINNEPLEANFLNKMEELKQININQLVSDTHTWHHQLKIQGDGIAFARSIEELTSDPNSRVVTEVGMSEVSIKIEQAIISLKKNKEFEEKIDGPVNLLVAPLYQLYMFWINGKGYNKVLIIDSPPQLEKIGIHPGEIYEFMDFLPKLSLQKPISGLNHRSNTNSQFDDSFRLNLEDLLRNILLTFNGFSTKTKIGSGFSKIRSKIRAMLTRFNEQIREN